MKAVISIPQTIKGNELYPSLQLPLPFAELQVT